MCVCVCLCRRPIVTVGEEFGRCDIGITTACVCVWGGQVVSCHSVTGDHDEGGGGCGTVVHGTVHCEVLWCMVRYTVRYCGARYGTL